MRSEVAGDGEAERYRAHHGDQKNRQFAKSQEEVSVGYVIDNRLDDDLRRRVMLRGRRVGTRGPVGLAGGGLAAESGASDMMMEISQMLEER